MNWSYDYTNLKYMCIVCIRLGQISCKGLKKKIALIYLIAYTHTHTHVCLFVCVCVCICAYLHTDIIYIRNISFN